MLTSLLANATQSSPMRPSSSLSSSSSSSLSSATNLATATAAAAAASMFPLPNAVNVHLTSGGGGGGLGSLIMHHPDNYRQHLHHHHHHLHHNQSHHQPAQQHGPNNLHQLAAHNSGSIATGSHPQPPFPSHHLTPTPSPVKEANGSEPQRLSSPTPSSSSEMGSQKCNSNSNSSNTNNSSHAPTANHSDLAGRAAPSTPAHQHAAHLHQHHPLHAAHPHLLLQTAAATVAAANYPMDIMERMQLSAAALQHQHQQLHSAHGNRGPAGPLIPPDDYSDARSSSVSSFQADSVHRADMDVDEGDVEDADEPDDDRFSTCSEDSDLSVGKEDENDAVRPAQLVRKSQPNPACHEDDSSSSRPTSRNPPLSMSFADKMSVDDLSNESTQKSGSSLCQLGQAPALSIVRPSPTRLQEEFLRNSQLYAEELMKHQISFMAATKSLQLSAAAGANSTDTAGERKTGFRPHVRSSNTDKSGWSQPSAKSELPAIEGMQFRGIHSHLNAISKITSALGRDMVSLASPIENVTSRESSQSPPSSTSSVHFNSQQQLHQHQVHHQQMINANLMHDSNLKFSIDNILKPGFGRRITDPLLKRNKPSKKLLAQQQRQHQKQQQLHSAEQLRSGTPIDLTPSATPASSASSSASSSFSASEAGHPEALSETNANRSSTSAHNAPAAASVADKVSSSSGATGSTAAASTTSSSASSPMVWPAWVYCTRYSDRPSSGRSPRTRRPKKPPSEKGSSSDEKRPRTAFSGPQLARLKHEFAENRYLTERRRQQLSGELGLNEAQIKIWFQNKRAKIKKSTGHKNPLALQLMAQGLYNHSTVPLTREEEELQELQAQGKSCS